MSTGESVPSLKFVLIPSADTYIPCAFLQVGFGRYFFERSLKNLQCLSCDSTEDCSLLAKHRDKQYSRIRCFSMQRLHPLCFGSSAGLMSKEGSAGSGMLRCVLKAKKISTIKTVY